MRRVLLALLFCVSAVSTEAAPTVTGRWEGYVEIPGRELALVVDLAPDAAGAWKGSIVIPGLGVKGAPLANIVVKASTVRFELGNELGGQPEGAVAFQAQLHAGGRMEGEMRQAGNVANFVLKNTGAAQVEAPRRSTSVTQEFEGRWSGEYELGGYARHVTIDLHNHAGAAATAEFVVVGKQTTRVPVDLVTQEGDLLTIQSYAYDIKFEGHLQKSGQIEGTFAQRADDLPLVLRRAAGSNS